MTKIYEQHDKAFSHVSTYAILKDGVPVAKVALKFPKDGAGRLWAYVHWIGCEMVRSYAGGYGYDKRSAAVQNAGVAFQVSKAWSEKGMDANGIEFINALREMGGKDWTHALQDAGFVVFQTA